MKLLSTRDAAMIAGVQPATIRKWHQRGKLTRFGTPRHPLWQIDELALCVTPRPKPRHAGIP